MPRTVLLDAAPGTELSIYAGKDEGEALGSLSMTVRDYINAATATSLLHTDWSFLKPGTYIDRQIIQGNLLPLQRNEAIQRMRGDWLMFIDDDMVWDSRAVGRLILAREELDVDILGALCFGRGTPHAPTMYMRERPTSGGYNFLEDWNSDVVEVDATGMAFVIIHKRVFEKIAGVPMPPFEERAAMGAPPDFFRWEGALGEDLRFCQDAKAAGCRIFVDTRIEVGHMAEVEIRRKHFLMELLGRDAEVYAARRALNDGMGLPTLDEGVIRRRLGWDD